MDEPAQPQSPVVEAASRQAAEVVPELVREMLAEGLDVRLRVTGSSMSPFLRSGDLVEVVPVQRRTPRVGDVVVRCHGERLVVHRLIALQTEPAPRWLTRGDAVGWPDRAVEGDALLGVVVAIERSVEAQPHRRRDGRPGWTPGLGPERRCIAWLSAHGLLLPLLLPVRMVYRLFRGLGSSRSEPSRKRGSNSSSADG